MLRVRHAASAWQLSGTASYASTAVLGSECMDLSTSAVLVEARTGDSWYAVLYHECIAYALL